MSLPKKLKFAALATIAIQVAPAVTSAAVDGDAQASDSHTIGHVFDFGYDRATCADPGNNCGTLMVNYSAGSVQFTLIVPEGQNDNTHQANPTDFDPPNDGTQKSGDLAGSAKLLAEPEGQLLAMDFLRGFKDKDDVPALKGEFAVKEDGPAEVGKHDWATAAATLMDHNFQQSSPDGITAPIHAGDGPVSPDGALALWRFQNVYEWEVGEDLREEGGDNISQVALENIYLSPRRTNYASDTQISVCDPNESSNCLPATDIPTSPTQRPDSPAGSPM